MNCALKVVTRMLPQANEYRDIILCQTMIEANGKDI